MIFPEAGSKIKGVVHLRKGRAKGAPFKTALGLFLFSALHTGEGFVYDCLTL